AFAHLTGNAGYPFVVALALLLPIVATDATRMNAWWHLATFLVCTFSVVAFYESGQRALGRPLKKRLLDVAAAMALGIGMSGGQMRAVLAGFFQGTGEFVRTPKRGTEPRAARYRSVLGRWPVLELLLTLWFGYGLVRAVGAGLFGSLPFLLLFFTGFAW